MAVSVQITSNLTATEVLTANVADLSDKTVVHSLNNEAATLNGATSPPVTMHAGYSKAMSGGAGSIDLTAMVGTNGVAVDGTGLRPQAIKFSNPITNLNPITVSKGASNGFDGLGADFSITLVPGMSVLVRCNEAGSDIAAGNRILDLVGTLTQALTYQIELG